ncbi:hypothetical protein FACS189440_09070 [Bacteroidia bacterium]|nr:hypothetical protein FACS189440_09070 [Bacteroidia bacterium]
MKKNLLFIACVLLFSVPVFSQEEVVVIEEEIIVPEEEIAQSSVIFDGSPYNFIFSWKKKATESHWTGLGFAFSNLKGLEGADLKMSKSYSVILNIGDYIVPFNQNWLFFTGVGMDFTRYHFKGNTGLQEVDNIAQFVPSEEGVNYKSSKLLAYYVTIPLMLEYQTKFGNNKVFFVNGGIEGMIKYYSKSQVDIRREEGTKKVELGRDLNILPINARLVLRAGFEDFSLFGYYQPYSMFKDGKGPDVNPYGIGVMLNF